MAEQRPEQPSDELLMHRFQQSGGPGSRNRQAQAAAARAALDELVGRYTGPALGVARQILFDRSLAEDAVQETFIRLIRGRDGYDASRRFSVWFYAILRNICVDMLRRRGREIRAMAILVSRAVPASDALTVAPPVHEDPGGADRLLAALPAPVRRAVALRVIEGVPFRDVAAALGISEEAAKKRVQRGLRTLRAMMELP